MIGIITNDHYFKFMGTPYHRKWWLYDCWVDILHLVNHNSWAVELPDETLVTGRLLPPK
jgi:hypothetical protein